MSTYNNMLSPLVAIYIIIASHRPRAMTVTTAESINIILYHNNRVTASASALKQNVIKTFSMYIHTLFRYMHTMYIKYMYMDD